MAASRHRPRPGLIEPQAEALIAATGADFRIGGARPFTAPTATSCRFRLRRPISSRSTGIARLFTNLSHWSGAVLQAWPGPQRVLRLEVLRARGIGRRNSGRFLCASLGIVPTVRHADYIGSWLEVLREDNRAIVRAASSASKAADYILGFQPRADPFPRRCLDRRRTGGGVMRLAAET